LIPLDPAGAQQTIGYLADMSRYAFASAELETVPLAQEIEFARAYLEIERARFGNRLRFELPGVAEMEGLRLPPLSIQPLVENAIRHGVVRRLDGGAVSIRVQRNGTRFSVSVDNETAEGTNIAEATFFQTSHALMNIRDRLRLIYNETASIEVSAPRPRTVSVTIRALTSVS
jgi:two-component system sensor histidine kinase AlgZ